MDRTIRKISLIIVMMGISHSIAYGYDEHNLFATAQRAYEQAHFKEALDAYRAMPTKGPAVWGNMGNCYYHEQDMVNALICWHRSLAGATYRDYCATQEKIERARRALGLSRERRLLPDALHAFAGSFPVGFAQLLFLILWFALWLAIAYRQRIKFFNFLIFGILIGVFFWVIVVYMQWNAQQSRYAVVIKKDSVLYAGPQEGYDALGNIAQGSSIELLQGRPGWYKVAQDERYGWVVASAVEPIKIS